MNNVISKLKALRRQEPFVPFVIVLNDGRRYLMRHGFQYAYTDDRVVVYIDPNRDLRAFFQPTDVTDIELAQPVS